MIGATGEMINVGLLSGTSSTQAYLVCHTDGTSSSASFAANQWYRAQAAYIRNGGIYSRNGFYQTSDERLKTFGNDIEIDLNKLSQLPKKYYTWKEDVDNVGTQIGTSAQELQQLYPELVSTGNNNTLTVDYARLSIIALKAIDILHKENQELKDCIKNIQDKLGL